MIKFVFVSKNQMFDRLSNLSVLVQGKVELEIERSQAKMMSNAAKSVQFIMQPQEFYNVVSFMR